jgi:xylulokinase
VDPALAGATAPEWNATARAAGFGLTAAHGRAHLIRAMLEGNAFALRDVVDAMRRAGAEPSELVCVGGGARGELLLQIRADVTGLPAARPEDPEITARGAAMLAAVGAGLHLDVPAAARRMRGPRRDPVHPSGDRQAVYEVAYARYRQLYAALRPLF